MSQEVSSLHATLGLQDTGFKRGLDEAKAALNQAARMTQDATRYMAGYEQAQQREAAGAQRAAAVKRQQIAIERELLGAKAQLAAVLGQESAAAQAVAQKYSLLTAAQQRELIATREQITAQKALQEAQLATAASTEKAALAAEAAAAKQLLAARANVGKNVTTVGRGLSGLAPPLAAFAGVGALAGNDVSQAEAAIRARTGAQGSQLAGLEQSLRAVAVTVPQSMKVVGEAIGDVAARTGLTGAALEKLTKTELDFARLSGSNDVAGLIRSTTQLFQQWGAQTRDQVPILDLLNRAHQRTGVSAQKLAADLAKFAPTFKNMGLGLVDATAALASFEKAGLPTERVMSALQQELARLAKAGITDSHRAFELIVHDLQNARNPMTAMKEATRLFGTELGGVMVQAIRDGRFNLQALEKTLTDGGDSIDKAAAQTRTFGVAFGQFRNQVEVALAPLGMLLLQAAAKVLDGLKPMIDHVKDAVGWFAKLSPGAQEATLGIVAAVALLGPAVVKIGGFVTTLMEMRKAWLELQLVMSAGGGGATGGVLGGLKVMGLAAVATGALWIGAFAAMGAAVYAFQTNWHGVTDDAVRGVRIFGGAVEKTLSKMKDAALLRSGGKSIGQMYQQSLSEAAGDERKLDAQLGQDYFRQRGGQAKPKGAAESALEKAIRDYKAEMERLQHLTSAGGGGGESDADIRARLAKAGAGAVKLTPLQIEQKQYTEQLAQAHVRLREELAGEDNVTARLQAHFHLLHLTNKDDLVVTEQRIRAHEKATAVTKSYRDALGRLQQQIRDVTSGESDKGLPAGFAKWTKPQQAAYRQTSDYATWLKDRSDASEALKQQEQQALKEIHKGNADWERELQAAARLRKYDPSKPQRGYPDVAAVLPTVPNLEQMAAKTFDRPLNQLTVTEQKELYQSQQHQAADVTTQQGADIFKAYAEKRIADAKKADDESVKSYNAAAALKQKADEAEVKRHEQMSQAAIKDFQHQTQAWSAEQRKQEAFLKTMAGHVADTFGKLFDDLMQHGFKGFFANVIHSFSDMFRQVAVDYARSEFKKIIEKSLHINQPQQQAQQQGGGGGGGFWGLVKTGVQLYAASQGVPMPGGLGFDTGAAGVNDNGAMMAPLPTFAKGGDFHAGKPFWTGERGPELVFPRSSGTVMPHAQSMALAGAGAKGGDTYHVNMTVVTQDAQSFQRPHNQQAIYGDIHRQLEKARRRGG